MRDAFCNRSWEFLLPNFMARTSRTPIVRGLEDIPPEVLVHVCRHLGLRDLIRVAESCKCFHHGGLATVELPTESPVVTVLCEHAFPRLELVPHNRPVGCSESWVAYLARCARQRLCREAPPIAALPVHSLFVDATGRLLSCGKGAVAGHGFGSDVYSVPTLVAAMDGVRVRSVAAAVDHSLVLGWDGRVYSWGKNRDGQLGQGVWCTRASPTPIRELEGVRSIAADWRHSLAVTESGDVFRWGRPLTVPPPEDTEGMKMWEIQLLQEARLYPTMVEGFGRVRVRRVCAGEDAAFAIGAGGELFSWGSGGMGLLGHGDTQDQGSPKRVEALQVFFVSCVSAGLSHAVALTEDGQVYTWGGEPGKTLLGQSHVESELQPIPIEALHGVRVGSVATGDCSSYAVTDTGELWAWGCDCDNACAISFLGDGEQRLGPLPKRIESLRGVKVDAVASSENYTQALADDGSVYVWGYPGECMEACVLGLGDAVMAEENRSVGSQRITLQRIPELRVTCGHHPRSS